MTAEQRVLRDESDRQTSEDLTAVRRGLARALAVWGVGSVAAGAVLAAVGRSRGGAARPRWWGAARQTASWGAVNLVVAALAARDASRPPSGGAGPAARRLGRLLLVNAVLDVGYVAAGAALVRRGALGGRELAGDGAAVVVQGAYLFVVDATAAAALGQSLRRGRTTRV